MFVYVSDIGCLQHLSNIKRFSSATVLVLCCSAENEGLVCGRGLFVSLFVCLFNQKEVFHCTAVPPASTQAFTQLVEVLPEDEPHSPQLSDLSSSTLRGELRTSTYVSLRREPQSYVT